MIKKLFHIADVHIRTYKRHEEYREQFDKFFESIKKEMAHEGLEPEECRIVIAGDLVHSKNTMTPELIKIVGDFLYDCTNICKTILTLGNHDLLVNNMDRMDAITPIVNLLNNPGLLYYKHLGCYLDENIVWCVYGHMEGSARPAIEEARLEFGDDKTYVGVYHDPIIGSKTAIGYEFEEGQDVHIFEGCDFVCMGDIHIRGRFDYKDGVAAYASSTIQQDFGELVSGHGYLSWDVEENDYTEVDLTSDYGFYTFNISSIDDIEQDKEILTNA